MAVNIPMSEDMVTATGPTKMERDTGSVQEANTLTVKDTDMATGP